MVFLGFLLERALTDRLRQESVIRDVDDGGLLTLRVHILVILSLTFASLSVAATLVTLGWFLRMKRTFRHEYVFLHAA